MTAPTLAPVDCDTDLPEIVHLVCDCNTERALCGLELDEDGWTSGFIPPEQRCVVCWDLMPHPCDRCGSPR